MATAAVMGLDWVRERWYPRDSRVSGLPARPARTPVDRQWRAPTCRDHSSRLAAAAWASPSATFTRVSTIAPRTKKTITESTAIRLLPNILTEMPKTTGPAMPANFSNTEKKPKYSDDLCFGIIRANSDRLRDRK